MLKFVVLILWVLVGVINLASTENITKVSYGLVWAMLVGYLITDIIKTYL